MSIQITPEQGVVIIRKLEEAALDEESLGIIKTIGERDYSLYYTNNYHYKFDRSEDISNIMDDLCHLARCGVASTERLNTEIQIHLEERGIGTNKVIIYPLLYSVYTWQLMLKKGKITKEFKSIQLKEIGRESFLERLRLAQNLGSSVILSDEEGITLDDYTRPIDKEWLREKLEEQLSISYIDVTDAIEALKEVKETFSKITNSTSPSTTEQQPPKKKGMWSVIFGE